MAINNRPTGLKVCGKDVIIKYVKKVDKEDSYGLSDGPMRTILIKAGLDESIYQNTLMHELIHMTLYLTGQSELLEHDREEALVIALENGLSEIYQLKST